VRDAWRKRNPREAGEKSQAVRVTIADENRRRRLKETCLMKNPSILFTAFCCALILLSSCASTPTSVEPYKVIDEYADDSEEELEPITDHRTTASDLPPAPEAYTLMGIDEYWELVDDQ
jgi:hypothetical protein